MQTEVVWQGRRQFLGISGQQGVEVMMAGPAPENEGGSEPHVGVRPMEMLLLGVGGCASYDVIQILEKSRQPIKDCRVKINAERADAVPAVFTSIHLHFLVEGDASSGKPLMEEKVARAIELSAEKYCSASIMFGKAGVNVTHSFELVG